MLRFIDTSTLVTCYATLHALSFILQTRRKFTSQTSDNMDRWKAEMERVRGKRRLEERRSEKRNSQKKEDAGARKGRKVAKHCVFSMICGSGGSKSRLAKAAGAEPSGQICTRLWREAHFEVKMYKTRHVRTTSGSWDVEKMHAAVARSTLRSKNVKSTRGSNHFWKLRCRKNARRCGAKHISKSKCTKHTIVGPLLEVEMSKKCTPLWHEVHVEVKMLKTPGDRTTFGRWDVVPPGRCKGLWILSKVSKTRGFVACSTTTTTTPYYTPIHYTTTTTTPSLHYTTLHYTALCYTALHYTTLHYTTLQFITLHYTPLHYITLHYTTFHYTTLHSTTLHYITLHYTLLRYTTTTPHYNYTTLHYTTIHSITLHYATLNYTTLHYTTLH